MQVLFYPAEPNKGYSYGEGTHTVVAKSVTQRGVLNIYQLEHAIRKKNIMKEPMYYTVCIIIAALHHVLRCIFASSIIFTHIL